MQQTYSGRIIHKLKRYALLGNMYQVFWTIHTIYEEALEDVDVREWKREMSCEMESMGSNSVRSLDVDVQEWKRVTDRDMEYMRSNFVKPWKIRNFF